MRASQSGMFTEPKPADSSQKMADRPSLNSKEMKTPPRHYAKIQRPFERIMNSFAWKVLIVVFTIILLFGSPIQILFTPKQADTAFDILYILALIIFVMDMIFNMFVDPNYFGIDQFRKHRVQHFDQAKFCKYGIGSFKMWCDVVSTAALLYDISYINLRESEEEVIQLSLDQFGYLINGDEINPFYPIEFSNFDSFVLVCKAARVARLIPATTVVGISSRMNFYWYAERLNPWWYYSKFRENREATKVDTLEPKEASVLGRHGFWGGLEFAVLAQVRALADEHRKKEKQLGFLGRSWERMKRGFRSLGILPNTNVELKRHIAASKIQRAWRRRLARPSDARFTDALDITSMDEDGSRRRLTNTGALERVLKKRSTYHRHNGRNARIANEGQYGNSAHQESSTRMKAAGKRADSQVGTAMAEVTGQWVASIILLGLILTILFTYQERDATRPSTMVVLHGQVTNSLNPSMALKAVNTSVLSVIPSLYWYEGEWNMLDETLLLRFNAGIDVSTLRDREKLKIIVDGAGGRTEGMFANRQEVQDAALVELLMTIFVLLVWFVGVTAFAGPIFVLVIKPIERMVRLLGMLMVDPLGYQTSASFKKFMFEEDALVKNSQWTKEVLKGMETSFLMSTILRIGSLMKVGFGSAGVEIIRNNLQKGHNKNMLILNSQGSTVSCIFLFCDIRQFTDVTECLQEEVFVFTNRIAAVVHSICHAYGGSANKNVGDAFLVSWLLEDDSANGVRFGSRTSQDLVAKHNQADKALLSVVKICIALYYDDYYVQTMSDNARTTLLNKLKNRPGPVVQMGFGLHAGKAVQGAIGSQRKIDATYVSEAVERAEYLESSTKRYGLKMLMSDTFHRLLHSSNRRRCRKIDQIMFVNDDDEQDEPSYDQGDIMELYTYDMDIDALWRSKKGNKNYESLDASLSESDLAQLGSARPSGQKARGRRTSVRAYNGKRESSGSDEKTASTSFNMDQGMVSAAQLVADFAGSTYFDVDMNEDAVDPGELVLPTGPTPYTSNAWLQEDMRKIRHQYTSVVFETFNLGLQRYYERDWAGAKQCFEAILERFDDGPSQYFLKQMKKHNWSPPTNFQPFGQE